MVPLAVPLGASLQSERWKGYDHFLVLTSEVFKGQAIAMQEIPWTYLNLSDKRR